MANTKHLNEKKHLGKTSWHDNLSVMLHVQPSIPYLAFEVSLGWALFSAPYQNTFFFFFSWGNYSLQKATNTWSTDFYCNVYLKKELRWLGAAVCNVHMCSPFSKIMKGKGFDHTSRWGQSQSSKYYLYYLNFS